MITLTIEQPPGDPAVVTEPDAVGTAPGAAGSPAAARGV
jgi:hypothetical protein